jgi:hypothetical protein
MSVAMNLLNGILRSFELAGYGVLVLAIGPKTASRLPRTFQAFLGGILLGALMGFLVGQWLSMSGHAESNRLRAAFVALWSGFGLILSGVLVAMRHVLG